ncbi:hypothetical protein [Microbacterium sp. UCD-TDU]|uniref:hypothetical protein n=1 Tax=Microbacterium sp. UCD-TDU TaxID=1247714 RepID=UPI0003800E5A|nr:hypothetical protein [Microbacterium sp. UCD-TDU]EYT59709.1 hypothetical protein D514_0108065 [Microbacterium sp. UCD-TDU]
MAWDWNMLWWWVADDAVWEWLRPLGAALLGAIVGGSFALWGQIRAGREQAVRDTATADRARADALRDQSRAEAMQLFTDFTELHRDIRNTPSTFADWADSRHWVPKWRDLWTDDRSLDIEVRARLLTDEDTRAQVQTVVYYLDRAARYAATGPGTYSPHGGFSIQYYVKHLADEGVAVVGAYLRGEPHATLREATWVNLRKVEAAYDEWEEYEVERAEQAAAAEAESDPERPNSESTQ